MKAAEQTSSHATASPKTSAPFFNKSGSDSFFGTESTAEPFFSPKTVQPKLTIGSPNDVYEQQADAVADQVVAKLNHPPTPSVQRQNIGAEPEKKLQLKENELEKTEEKLQMKPIFESLAPPLPSSNEDTVQRKCADCDKEDKEKEPIQKKNDGDTEGSPSADLSSRLSSSKGGGSPLSDGVRGSMESAIGADFSGVRVHTGSESVQMNRELNAQAFAHGNDVYFGAGKYNPSSSSGQHLLAHELVHTVQQGASINKKIQRRELDTGTSLIQGDWLTTDRTQNTSQWATSNLYNLNNLRSSQYNQVEQRRDFYLWFYNHTAALGYTTRWPLAAHIVAGGAGQIANLGWTEDNATSFGVVDNELQALMRQGNQVIFDNVFPKLRDLLNGGVLTGQAALDWDSQTLSEEQQLIQPLYAQMSHDTFQRLNSIATQGILTQIGAFITGGGTVPSSTYVRGGDIPKFSGGSLNSVEDRWRYGMSLGNTFSPSSTGYTQSTPRPQPGTDYSNGTALAAVNIRPHLHRLDAELDNIGSRGRGGRVGTMNAQVVLQQLRALSQAEQAELLTDVSPDRSSYAGTINIACQMDLSRPDVLRIITNMHINLQQQMNFIRRFNHINWNWIDYSDIQTMITSFSVQDRQFLNNDSWRPFFIGVCDDSTIVDAVNDIGMTNPLRQTWIDDEVSWF